MSKFFIYFRRVALCLFITTAALYSSAQNNIRGRILYENDSKPASAVSVTLLNQHSGKISDQSGNFDFDLPAGSKNDDTLVISSIGYQSIRIPVKQALEKKEFRLVEASKELPVVIIKSFNNEQVIGDNQENSAYFRSWNTAKTGGEIGRVFPVYHKEYKLNRVKFKVNNRCNVCMVRLRIRRVVNGMPEEELVTDSISVPVKSLTMNDKMPEFDLNKYNIILKEKEIFVGLEVLTCEAPVNTTGCSFCFVGTEKGSYIYKSRGSESWSSTPPDDYSIHLKLFLSY